MIKHFSPISGVAALGNSLVATAGYDSQIILWDSKKKISLTRVCHDHLVNQCRFSSCGKFLVSASSDYSARVWSVPSLQLVSVMHQHDDDVEMAVFDPFSSKIATASRDHNVRIFDIYGNLLHKLVGHTADVISVEWIQNGTKIVSSSDDGTVRIWLSDSGKLDKTIDLGGIETDTIVSDESGTLYIGNDEGEIIIIGNHKKNIPAHKSGIKRLVFEPNKRLILSASYDRTVKIWKIENNSLNLCHIIDVPDCVWLRSAAFVGESKIVFGTFGSSYASYDLAEQKWDLKNIDDTPGLNSVNTVNDDIFSIGDAGVLFKNQHVVKNLGSLCNFIGNFNGHVVTGGQTGILFDGLTGKIIYQHTSPLNCCSTFFKNGKSHLIVGAYTGEGLIFVENIDGNVEYLTTIRLHENAIKGIACNNEFIFSVCADCSAAFHSIDQFNCTLHIPNAHDKIANGAACLSDQRFASVSRDLNLRLWKNESFEVIHTPHDHSIKCVAASQTTPLIVTGSYDGKISLYNWKKNSWVKTERLSNFGISSVAAFDKSGKFLASSYDGKIYSVNYDYSLKSY